MRNPFWYITQYILDDLQIPNIYLTFLVLLLQDDLQINIYLTILVLLFQDKLQDKVDI